MLQNGPSDFLRCWQTVVCGPHGALFCRRQRVLQDAESRGSQRSPPRFQRKPWEARKCVPASESLPAAAQRVTREVVRVNPRLQGGPQEGRGARDVEQLPRKTGASEQSQPRERPVGSPSQDTGMGLPKFSEAHIVPPCTLDAGHGRWDFMGTLLGEHCFGLTLPWYSPILPF